MSEQHKGTSFGIANRIAVVSGGNRNIGRSIVLTLAKEGAKPVILYHGGAEEAKKVCAEVAELGVKAVMYQADLADTASLAPLVKKIEQEQGGIDILINNAAIRPNTKISKITLEEWDLVFNTNLKAPFFLSQAVLPGMIARKWGRIINIGGTDAYWGKVRRAHGVSAKLGLVGLTRAMALEVARFGVTINVVIPGTIDTQRPHPEWYPELKSGYAERLERIPMARLGDTQQVANACLFLASDLASFTTAQELFASGGAVPLVRQTLDEYSADEF
jgi:NAD(P)-dependent dehydrogenase (short-subunit alcohol dehydrogenase family)